MTDRATHTSHPDIINRLKRVDGHVRSIIGMLETGRPCAEIAPQIKAVESAVTAARRALIDDHIDHCLGHGGAEDLTEIRALTKLL